MFEPTVAIVYSSSSIVVSPKFVNLAKPLVLVESVTVREPLGVVAAIIPWNVPMLLMALKVAPALVAGNTVVVKSAEEAPLTVLRIC